MSPDPIGGGKVLTASRAYLCIIYFPYCSNFDECCCQENMSAVDLRVAGLIEWLAGGVHCDEIQSAVQSCSSSHQQPCPSINRCVKPPISNGVGGLLHEILLKYLLILK